MSDNEAPHLSAETFAVLQEFYKEQEEKEQALKSPGPGSENVQVEEDWQLSQFWYDENTVEGLVNIAAKSVGSNGKIALISCPTLYKRMKLKMGETGEVTLFEFDRRFSIFGTDFVPYDYKSPLNIASNRKNYYDLVIADPPFLALECLTRTGNTMKFLTKQKLILCTGAVMEDVAENTLGLKKSLFEPRHQNNLANEFVCYSNYDIDQFL